MKCCRDAVLADRRRARGVIRTLKLKWLAAHRESLCAVVGEVRDDIETAWREADRKARKRGERK